MSQDSEPDLKRKAELAAAAQLTVEQRTAIEHPIADPIPSNLIKLAEELELVLSKKCQQTEKPS